MSDGSSHCLLRSRNGLVATDLLVVSIVLALLAGVFAANATGGILRARQASLLWTLQELQVACDAFQAVCGEAPAYAVPSGPSLLHFSASDHGGKTFLPAYLRSRPAMTAHVYGLSAEDGAYVYFGITPGGRVFATQQQPDLPGGWTSVEAPVFVAGSTKGLSYRDISRDQGQEPPILPIPPIPPTVPDPPGPPVNESIASVELVSSRSTANTGEEVYVTAKALTGDGRPVSGVPLSFEVSGSATGTRHWTRQTDGLGQAQIIFTTTEAEIVVVRARAPQ